jgi:hypothetical protein
MRWYTDLRLVFDALDGRQREFDWLLTDLDLIHVGAMSGEPEPPLNAEPLWLTGAELTHIVGAFDIQFVRAVLCEFTNLSRAHTRAAAEVAEGSGREYNSFLDFYCPGCRAPVRIYYRSWPGGRWTRGHDLLFIVTITSTMLLL